MRGWVATAAADTFVLFALGASVDGRGHPRSLEVETEFGIA